MFTRLIALFTGASLLLSSAPVAFAAGNATMSLSSAKTQYAVGSTFTVNVNVAPGGESIIVARARISYPQDLLELIAYSQNGLFQNKSPGETIGNGIINIGGFNLQEGIKTGGVMGTITFRAKNNGAATLYFLSGSHLIDENQDDKYGGGTGITLTLGTGNVEEEPTPTPEPTPAPTPEPPTPTETKPSLTAPVVTSKTHPTEDAWYSNNNAELCWPKLPGQLGYAFTINQSPEADPGYLIDSEDTCFNYREASRLTITDGIWFFRIRAKYADGFSPVSTFRTQIDTTPPDPFEIFFEGATADDAAGRFQLSFAAPDAASGIDHYTLLADDAAEGDVVESPHVISEEDAGAKTITIVATDKAGNTRAATLDMMSDDIQALLKSAAFVNAEPVLPPTVLDQIRITSVNKNLFFAQRVVTFEGTAQPNLSITVHIRSDEVTGVTTSDDKGTWRFNLDQPLAKGPHAVYAVAARNGIDSAPSDAVSFTLDEAFLPKEFLRPWVYIAGALVLILAFAGVTWRICRSYCAARKWRFPFFGKRRKKGRWSR